MPRIPYAPQRKPVGSELASAIAAFAGGLHEQRAQSREEAMKEAMLAVQRMNAQPRPFLTQSPFEDPERSGAEHVLIDPTTGQPRRTGVSAVPPKEPSPWMMPFEVGGQPGVVGVPRTPGVHSPALPPGARSPASDRQSTRLLEPSAEQTSRAGLVRSLIESRRELNKFAAQDPTLGQRAGLVNMLSGLAPGAKAEDALAALISRGTGDPAVQAYIAEMLNFTSDFAFARGGKALTVNELSILLPQAFGFGFETGPAAAQRARIRDRLVTEALMGMGDEGLVYAIERGFIDQADVPNFQLFLDRIKRFYGREVFVPTPAAPQGRGRHDQFLTPR